MPKPGLLSTLALTLFLSNQMAQAERWSFPEDYHDRFGHFKMSHEDSTYGVRYLPLPLKYDIQLILVKHPEYYEYGVSGTFKETDFTIGVLKGGEEGIRTLDINHNPDDGLQYNVYLQWPNSDEDTGYPSNAEVGYAKSFTVARMGDLWSRIYGAVGYVGEKNDLSQPYTHLEGEISKDFPEIIKNEGRGTDLSLNLDGILSNYYFGQSKKGYTTLELNAGIKGNLTENLSMYARHQEILDFGLGDNNLYGLASDKDRNSYAGINYKIDRRYGRLNWHSVQYDYTHYWFYPEDTDNRAEVATTLRLNMAPALRLDLSPGYDFYWGGPTLTTSALFRLPEVKGAFGPSIKFNWLSTGDYRWVLSFASSDKEN